MIRFTNYLIVWSDDARTLPSPKDVAAFAELSAAHQGELLALGPTRDSYEQESRSPPAWMGVARFADESGATGWFQEVGNRISGTTLLVPALSGPVWWPPALESKRPAWSRRVDPPSERLALHNCVWADITDGAKFLEYSQCFAWTVEQDGGALLAAGPFPRVLGGGPGPQGIGLMGWPGDEVRRAWFDGEAYGPYKQQRRESSRSTSASVIALRGSFTRQPAI